MGDNSSWIDSHPAAIVWTSPDGMIWRIATSLTPAKNGVLRTVAVGSAGIVMSGYERDRVRMGTQPARSGGRRFRDLRLPPNLPFESGRPDESGVGG